MVDHSRFGMFVFLIFDRNINNNKIHYKILILEFSNNYIFLKYFINCK